MRMIARWLNNQKLYTKMLCILVVTCVMLLLGWISVWQIVCNAYNELIYEKTAQVYIAYSEQMETKLDKLGTITLSIIGDNGMQSNLTILQDGKHINERWLSAKNELGEQLRSHLYGNDELKGVCIYNADISAPIALSGYDLKLSDETIKKLLAVSEAGKGGMDIVVSQQKMYIVRQIRRTENLALDNLGTIIGELNISGILEENGKVYAESESAIKVSLFVGGDCIYSDDTEIQQMSKDGWQIEKGYFVTQCTTKRGWRYLFYTPYDEIISTIRATIFTVMMLSIVIMVFILILSRFMLNKTLCKLDELVLRFDAYAKGIMPTEKEMQVYKNRMDEIGYLNRQFERMVYAHKKLEDENYQRMLLHKEAQYKQLQHQIRPHFIFNTLSMISWTAYRNQDTETVKLTKALSELLRGAMSTTEETVVLEKEIKLVEHYMHILYTRYRDRIDFQMSIPEEMLKIRIPYMTLQPIIENAVNYGLEEDLDVCVIRVYGKVEADKAILFVEDNGPGVEANIIEKLLSGEKKPNGNGVGLLNVQKRIELAFSDNYGLSFHRIDGHTQVQIIIPR